jgi:microcin C transport system substrate-binding protein
LRDIDRLIYETYPYVLLWYSDHTRLFYWNKFGMPAWVLAKYGNEYGALTYWWLDEDAVADLEAAQKTGQALPPKPLDIKFDELFTK